MTTALGDQILDGYALAASNGTFQHRCSKLTLVEIPELILSGVLTAFSVTETIDLLEVMFCSCTTLIPHRRRSKRLTQIKRML